MYFTNFPKIYYAFKFKDELGLRVMLDITRNVRPLKKILDNSILYGDYDVSGEDTPEIIAERLYGNPELHWILLLINEKYDYLNDWPIPDSIFNQYVAKKYGEGNENNVHMLHGREHYRSPTGRVVDSTYPQAVPVTNFEYEYELNQSKKRIKVVQPKYVSIFVNNLEEAFPA